MAEQKSEKEPGLFVSSDEEEEEVDGINLNDVEIANNVATDIANTNVANPDNDDASQNGHRSVHHACKKSVYDGDGRNYKGSVRRCKAVRYNRIYATWCYCSRQKKCKPEVNFVDKNGNITCQTCYACRAHSLTRGIKDPAERNKAKGAKIEKYKGKAKGKGNHYDEPKNEIPRRNPDSDDEDMGSHDGSSGGGLTGTLLTAY